MKTEYIPQLVAEAIIVGILFIIFYMVVEGVIPKGTIPQKLLIAGALGHLVLEVTGVNKYYCKHSFAVKNCSCGCSASKEARGEVKPTCNRKK